MKRFLTLSSVLLLPFVSILFVSILFAQETSSPAHQKQQEEAMLHTRTISAFQALKEGDITKLDELGLMLSDPRLNTVARTALENMPERAGLETLRRGLGSADSRCVAGCVMSLGNLRDTDSVPRLVEYAQCDCHPEIVRVAALHALGKIGGADAQNTLEVALKDPYFIVQRTAADGLFQLAQTMKMPDSASIFRKVREAKIDGATTCLATQHELLLTGDTELFHTLFISEDDADFRTAKIVLSQTDKTKIFDATLETLMSENVPTTFTMKRKLETMAVLGATENKALTSHFQELLTCCEAGKCDIPCTAILESLGQLRDPVALETLAKYLTSEDENVQRIAIEGICRLNAECVVKIIGNKNQNVKRTLAEIEIVERLKLVQFAPWLKMLMTEKKSEEETGIASTAMLAYARLITPGVGDVAEFTTVFDQQQLVPADVFESAMTIICQRITDKAGAIDFLAKTYPTQPTRLMRYVAMIGGKAGAEFLGFSALRYAEMPENADAQTALDTATEALGKWSSADAGPVLGMLAVTLPIEKYRGRCMRGYFRILRQMGMTPLEKRQMLNTALYLTEGEGKASERAHFTDVMDRFQSEFPEKQLFNGNDFAGWEMLSDVFRIEDGAIIGGNFETGVDRNQFLTTTETYSDFYLRLDCKIVDAPTNEKCDGNAGIQFRSQRIPENHEMIGYQADMTSDGGYWGHLYDESRRRRMLQTPSETMKQLLLSQVWKKDDWNRYEILCQGRNIRIFLNGVETVNFTEEDESLPQIGLIGLQIHAGGPAQAYYKNVFISTATTSDSQW